MPTRARRPHARARPRRPRRDGLASATATLSFFPRAQALGVVLPSNSPGVHALWVPAIALKTALVLKPGSAEPWTPYRLIQAFITAGVPPEAFGYYPSRPRGRRRDPAPLRPRHGLRRRAARRGVGRATRASRCTGPATARSCSARTRRRLARAPRPDGALDRRERRPLLRQRLRRVGHRRTRARSRRRLRSAGAIAAAPRRAIRTRSSRPSPDRRGRRTHLAQIDDGTRRAGRRRRHVPRRRHCPRLVDCDGCTYLLPTVVFCDARHPLANREFLFPFASVVELAGADMSRAPEPLGPTLALSAADRRPGLVDACSPRRSSSASISAPSRRTR